MCITKAPDNQAYQISQGEYLSSIIRQVQQDKMGGIRLAYQLHFRLTPFRHNQAGRA